MFYESMLQDLAHK